jgi:hypothetical protein
MLAVLSIGSFRIEKILMIESRSFGLTALFMHLGLNEVIPGLPPIVGCR